MTAVLGKVLLIFSFVCVLHFVFSLLRRERKGEGRRVSGGKNRASFQARHRLFFAFLV